MDLRAPPNAHYQGSYYKLPNPDAPRLDDPTQPGDEYRPGARAVPRVVIIVLLAVVFATVLVAIGMATRLIVF